MRCGIWSGARRDCVAKRTVAETGFDSPAVSSRATPREVHTFAALDFPAKGIMLEIRSFCEGIEFQD